MHPGLEPGTYQTKAGSVVRISGKHGGIVDIEFDWCEENACCDAEPFVLDGTLCWACECHENEPGGADLVRCDDPKKVDAVCGVESVDVVSSCSLHGPIGSEKCVLFAGRRWCPDCLADLFHKGGVQQIEMRRVSK